VPLIGFAGQRDVPLRRRADQEPRRAGDAGVDQEGPVGVPLGGQQRVERPERRQPRGVAVPDEGPAQDEVRPLARADLLVQDGFHGAGVGVVVDVERAVQEDRTRREGKRAEGNPGPLGDPHREQRGGVVVARVATLAQLAVGDEDE
jgi:hypothetical protein